MPSLRELHEAATSAPWEDEGSGHVHADGLLADIFGARLDADAALIAAMRNALPLLLDVVDAARAVVGGPNSELREEFPDGGDIILRWEGNRADWERARAALAALDGAAQ